MLLVLLTMMSHLYDNLYKTIGLILAENGETRTLSLLRMTKNTINKVLHVIEEPLVFEYNSEYTDEDTNDIIHISKCKCFISFGDGNSMVFDQIKKSYKYKVKGVYRIKIYKVDGGRIDHILFPILTLNHMTNFITLGDIGIVNLDYLFSESDFNAEISPNFNTSNITSMNSMFYECCLFNQPIGHCDTSNVKYMNYMFCEAISFNQPIGGWDVSQVTDMRAMFYGAVKFNQPIGNWDTSNVVNMNQMFSNAKNFNQPIGRWDVSQVTNMGAMFYSAVKFNQPIGNWTTSGVIKMGEMFSNAKNFNQPIGR